jgi:hypothetical protein
MKCSMNSFKGCGLADRAEFKAILFALASCFIFIGFLVAINRSPSRIVRSTTKVHISPPPPPPAPRVTERPPDKNQQFRVVPSNFRGLDFSSRSYGDYRLSNGTIRDLVLIDGQFREFGDSQHWFDLNDVFYTDLTGDGSPEAIVMMTHIECGRICDGGKNLIYVYSMSPRLQEILKYESGSGMQGCSLKSLTVDNKHLTLDSFGKCPPAPGIINDFVRYETYDLTRIEFAFNGNRLVPKRKTFLTLPNNQEVSYGVDVRISENHPLPHEL